jgi:hypothetical protein
MAALVRRQHHASGLNPARARTARGDKRYWPSVRLLGFRNRLGFIRISGSGLNADDRQRVLFQFIHLELRGELGLVVSALERLQGGLAQRGGQDLVDGFGEFLVVQAGAAGAAAFVNAADRVGFSSSLALRRDARCACLAPSTFLSSLIVFVEVQAWKKS